LVGIAEKLTMLNVVNLEVKELIIKKGIYMKAVWKDCVIAHSNETVVVEGNHYFPINSLDHNLINISHTTSFCPWKGTANYYDVVVKGDVNQGAAWFYPEPKEAAKQILDHVAFWKGVEVIQ
jgi:uncharacterized protein (DUF427 family)